MEAPPPRENCATANNFLLQSLSELVSLIFRVHISWERIQAITDIKVIFIHKDTVDILPLPFSGLPTKTYYTCLARKQQP